MKQKPRHAAPEKVRAVEEEVQILLQAGAIRETKFSEWILNPVVVRKKNEKWRVCIDFTDLNKACPNDSFPLPRIGQLVDSAVGYERLSFLDAYSGYHQIPLFGPDQDCMAFVTTMGLHCYKVMPFGLKNARATYQRLVTKMFKDEIGKSMEVYVDDMLVKSKLASDHIQDLRKTFEILRHYRMKLNAANTSSS